MKVDDRMDFVSTMEKEITDHKKRGHWTIVDKASLPFNGIHHISYQNEVNTNKVFTKCQSIEDNGRLDVTSVMNIYIYSGPQTMWTLEHYSKSYLPTMQIGKTKDNSEGLYILKMNRSLMA